MWPISHHEKDTYSIGYGRNNHISDIRIVLFYSSSAITIGNHGEQLLYF